MKALKYALSLGSLLFLFSCAHNHNHKCCSTTGPKACATGQCKLDKSCCENKCGNCTGEKKSCTSGQCSTHRKKN